MTEHATETDPELAIADESHASSNRAGFSVILLGDDKKGIELGFWTDRIWAQSGPDFVQAEGAAYNTASTVLYDLSIRGLNYVLSANGNPILTGLTRDYTSAAPIIPPIRACDELVGMPKYQVIMFQLQAPNKAPKITVLSIMWISMIPLPTVLATCRPMKENRTSDRNSKNAAHRTALPGESTRVETMVAIALAES